MLKKSKLAILCILTSTLLIGCGNEIETMELLDAEIAAIHVHASSGLGVIHEDKEEPLFSFTDEKRIDAFSKAIRRAVKQHKRAGETEPDFDLLIEYADGSPTHALHLWIDGENMLLSYIIDEAQVLYVTPDEDVARLKGMLHQ